MKLLKINNKIQTDLIQIGNTIKFKYGINNPIDFKGKVVFLEGEFFLINTEEIKSFRIKYVREVKLLNKPKLSYNDSPLL